MVFIIQSFRTIVFIFIVVWIFLTNLDDFYPSGFSDYCLHLYCYIPNISTDISSQVLQETPEEGRRTYQPKCWEYDNKDNNSPKTLNNSFLLFFCITLYYYCCYWLLFGCPHGKMIKSLDCRIVVSKFELQSRYYVHFQTNTLGKSINPLILPAMD